MIEGKPQQKHVIYAFLRHANEKEGEKKRKKRKKQRKENQKIRIRKFSRLHAAFVNRLRKIVLERKRLLSYSKNV